MNNVSLPGIATVESFDTTGSGGPQRQSITLASIGDPNAITSLTAGQKTEANSIPVVIASDQSELAVEQASPPVGAANININQVTVATGATLIVAARAGAPGVGRVAVTIQNLGSTEIFLGGAGVTTANGFPLPGDAGASITLNTTTAIYGVVASGSQAVAFVETY